MNGNTIEYVINEYLKNTDFSNFNSHNGPYHDEETPIRVVAHYLSFLCRYSRKYDVREYDNLITELYKKLYEEKYRPGGSAFLCRNGKKKDKTNGVIGQAWVIEALTELYLYSGIDKYIDEAKKLFKLHPYNLRNGIWHRIDLDGSILHCDMTFNHQLWFASMGAYINSVSKDDEIKHCLDCFVGRLMDIFEVHNNGLVKHTICSRGFREKVKYRIKDLRELYWNLLNKPSMKYREIGYHSFNMYGFAMLYEYYGDNDFFRTDRFLKALNYCGSSDYKRGLALSNHKKDIKYKDLLECTLKCNRYGYSYNVSGYEIMYVIKVFGSLRKNDSEDAYFFFNNQKKYTIQREEYEDRVIVNARTYELLRLL